MRAMVVHRPAAIESNPLVRADLPTPTPAAGEILVRVTACGVCRTDLHVCEGDLAPKHPPALDYDRHLFYERELRSVIANTRADGEEFLKLAGEIPIRTSTIAMELEEANRALAMLKRDELKGAAVLRIS